MICLFITTLFVLSGFMFFRMFRIPDGLAVVLSGLMASSPIFILFTYQQTSARGFIVPFFVLSLYMIFWTCGPSRTRLGLFSLLTVGAFAMHRSSFMMAIIELIAALVVSVGPFVPRMSPRLKPIAYIGLAVVAALLLLWPNIGFLRELFSGVPELSLSYRLGEWEFRTGFLFRGDSIPVLLGNLGANYVGGMGLAFLFAPIGLLMIYPVSFESRERDVFVLFALVVVAPLLWKAQYLQLLLLPIIYLLLGISIHRRERCLEYLKRTLHKFNRRSESLGKFHSRRARKVVVVGISIFLLACFAFSVIMFVHRSNIAVPNTALKTWPSDHEVMMSLYVGEIQLDNHTAFVTASDMFSRRVQWYSGWVCPVADSTILRADNYLKAGRHDFIVTADSHNYFRMLFSFYNFESYYTLSDELPNRSLYYLSYGDIYGFFRLYFVDPNDAYAPPRVSANEAGVSVVIQINSMRSAVHNLYFGEGVMQSRFLKSVGNECYSLYQNEYCTAYLVAEVV